jgi:hypothetical protein
MMRQPALGGPSSGAIIWTDTVMISIGFRGDLDAPLLDSALQALRHVNSDAGSIGPGEPLPPPRFETCSPPEDLVPTPIPRINQR